MKKCKKVIVAIISMQMVAGSVVPVFADLEPVPMKISAGSNHTLILDSYGYVYSFGDNTYNQLGTKTTVDNGLFNECVEGIGTVSDISTYANHNLALADGKVYAWGDNSRYQIGVTYNGTIGTPEEVELTNDDGTVPIIVDVEAGGWYSLALDSDNNLWAWGDNKYGQFANGSTDYRSDTARIVQSNVSAFSAGKYHILAIIDGVVQGWGRSSDDYALGDTALYSQANAIDIQGLPDNIIDVEAGDTCSFFITDNGEVYAMGLNSDGRLGDGTTTTKSVPTLLPITGVKDVESNGTTLFLLENGDVYACGLNDYGQIGQGHTNTRYQSITKVPGTDYDAIASGGEHNLLYTASDFPYENEYASVYATGRNNYGQCISTTEGNITYPEAVIDIPNPDDLGPFAWDSLNLRPIDATYISQNGENGSTNFYGESSVKVCYTPSEYDSSNWGKYAYLKFDTSNIENEQISSAKLHLYVENGGDMRESTREIGVYSTCENTWNGENITWNNEIVRSRDLLGTFEVTGTGYRIEDPGWREVDVTEYLKNSIDDELSVMLKMISNTAHEVEITSGVCTEDDYINPSYLKKNYPVLSIELDTESDMERDELYPIDDTYIYQNGNSRYLNFVDEEYLSVTYTPNETRSDYWGQDAVLNFNTSSLDKRYIDNATLWLYVDPSSDIRNSKRILEVSGNTPSRIVSNITTWDLGRNAGDTSLGTFSVTGNGYDVLDYGWKCIDVTEFVKNSEDTMDIIIQMTSDTQHRVNIRSNDHSDVSTRPRLSITTKYTDAIFAAYENGNVTIDGLLGSEGEKEIVIRIFAPNKELKVIDQISSDSTGDFEYNYNLQDAMTGTYQVLVSVEGEEKIRRTLFDIGEKTDIGVINVDTISSIAKPSVTVLSDSMYIQDNDIITVNAKIAASSSNTVNQNVSTVIALYNSDGIMHSYSASSIDAHPGVIEKLWSEVLTPDDVFNMTLKVFTLEGKNIHSGSMIPLSEVYSITNIPPEDEYAILLETPDEPMFIDDVVFDEYADQYSVYDVTYSYGHENSYREKIILPGETLTISSKVKNKNALAANIGEAFYTQIDGEEQYVQLSTYYTIKAGETRTVSWDVPSEYTAYPPESDPVYPSNWISDEGGLTTEHQDYFSENIKESVLVETDKFIKGKIDERGDIDCVKFVAPTTGYYEVANTDGILVNVSLYSEDLIDESDPLNGFKEIESTYDYYLPNSDESISWSGNLEEGKTYALRISAADFWNVDEYECYISVDTDEDGLSDIWEITGDINGDGIIDIPNADPYKTDIYVEINWMTDFKPLQESLDIVSESFANSGAGYQNKGINLHNIWGTEHEHKELIVFEVDEDDDVNVDEILLPYFTNSIRQYTHHCAVFGDQYCLSNDSNVHSSGYASFYWGQVLFIAMGCIGDADNDGKVDGNELLPVLAAAGTYMHELGHNFGLEHGGQDGINFKPNYLSVMNYSFQFDGIYSETNKNYYYDYSHYEIPNIDERSLSEELGVDPQGITKDTGYVTYIRRKLYDENQNEYFIDEKTDEIAYNGCDFNGDGDCIDELINYDLTDDNELSVLTSQTDWDKLILRCGNIGKRINDYSSGFSLLSVDSSHKGPIELPYYEYYNTVQEE